MASKKRSSSKFVTEVVNAAEPITSNENELQSHLNVLLKKKEDLDSKASAARKDLSKIELEIKSINDKLQEVRNEKIIKFINKDFIDVFTPFHSRNNCNDNSVNWFGSDDYKCPRCVLLTILKYNYIDPGYTIKIDIENVNYQSGY